MSTRMFAATVALTAAVGLTACTHEQPAERTAEPAQLQATNQPVDGVEPFPANPSADTQAAEGADDLLLVDARVGHHLGFDRVVLEFTGTATPGWTAQYLEEVVQDGSGKPITLDGEGLIEVRLAGVRFPEKSEEFFLPDTLDAAGQVIEQTRVDGAFESYQQVVLGVSSAEAPFRVFSLTDPTRVVIDVQTSP